MAKIDFVHCVPEVLAEQATLGDLWETIRGTISWTEREAEVLDFIYRFRLIRLLRTRAHSAAVRADLRALHEHLEGVVHPVRSEALNHLEKPYAARWAAYREIVENRLAAIESPAPASFLNRAHVREILVLIRQGRVRNQHEIEQTLDLKAPNVTRILKIMEVHEIIERRAVGREKILLPGPKGELLLAEYENEETGVRRPSKMPRHGIHLTQHTAA